MILVGVGIFGSGLIVAVVTKLLFRSAKDGIKKWILR
jgi:hypothetical protein